MANSQINISINAQDHASTQVAAVSNNIANLNTTIINISQVLQGLNVTWDMLGEKLKKAKEKCFWQALCQKILKQYMQLKKGIIQSIKSPLTFF